MRHGHIVDNFMPKKEKKKIYITSSSKKWENTWSVSANASDHARACAVYFIYVCVLSTIQSEIWMKCRKLRFYFGASKNWARMCIASQLWITHFGNGTSTAYRVDSGSGWRASLISNLHSHTVPIVQSTIAEAHMFARFSHLPFSRVIFSSAPSLPPASLMLSRSYVSFCHVMHTHRWEQHDPEQCTPGGEDGNYIMFARATSGDKRNNNKFSPCSLKAIEPVLNAKARSAKGCFTGTYISLRSRLMSVDSSTQTMLVGSLLRVYSECSSVCVYVRARVCVCAICLHAWNVSLIRANVWARHFCAEICIQLNYVCEHRRHRWRRHRSELTVCRGGSPGRLEWLPQLIVSLSTHIHIPIKLMCGK